ncbi:protein FAM180A-like [Aulostomus maculatus]
MLQRKRSEIAGTATTKFPGGHPGTTACTPAQYEPSESQALFPAASKLKRGASEGDPIFLNSFDDAHLLFEILLAGIHFDTDGEISVRDAELASLRKTQTLEIICEDIIPRKLSDVLRLISDLSSHLGHLHQDDFERTLLTLVYTTQQMVSSTTKHQRDVWAESFVSLYKAIKQDLTETN